MTDDATYEGGFVVTPMPGHYEGVAMLDGKLLVRVVDEVLADIRRQVHIRAGR